MKLHSKLLILSGMHGDESGVIDCVRTYIAEHNLPEHVYIPEVSPSAVAARTRRNRYGHDVNRSFFDPPKDPEVSEFTSGISGKYFDLCINFHEDPDLAQTFYLYDSGQLSTDQLLSLRSSVIEAGSGLHTGTDDPLDADLDLHVEKGYISTPYDSLPQDAGFSWVWFSRHGITKRDVDIEIPGKASTEMKQKLVNLIFDTMHIFGS
jgi:hypothetical protein